MNAAYDDADADDDHEIIEDIATDEFVLDSNREQEIMNGRPE